MIAHHMVMGNTPVKSASKSTEGVGTRGSGIPETNEGGANTNAKTVAQTFMERRKRSPFQGAINGSQQRAVLPVNETDTTASKAEACAAPATQSSATPPGRSSTKVPPPSSEKKNVCEIKGMKQSSSPSSSSVSASKFRQRLRRQRIQKKSLPSISTGGRRISTIQSLPSPTNQSGTKASPLLSVATTADPAIHNDNKNGNRNKEDKKNAAAITATANDCRQPTAEPASPLATRSFPQTKRSKKSPHMKPNASTAFDLKSTARSTSLDPSPLMRVLTPNDSIHESGTDISDCDDNSFDSLDDIVTSSEEKCVLRRLLQNIEAAEDEIHYTQLYPSLLTSAVTVEHMAVSRVGAAKISGTSSISSWKTPSIPGPHHQAPAWRKSQAHKIISSKTPKDSRLGEIIILPRRKVQQSLPKWIPCESGRYSDKDDSSSLLFTRPQFMRKVVFEAKKLIHDLDWQHHVWTATLSDHNPKEPHSYLLEAEGSNDAIDILGNLAHKFVRLEIERTNLELLVGDGASLVIDLKCLIHLNNNTAQQALGVCFSPIQKATTEGVYIKSMNLEGALAKAINDPEVFNKGCALLAVNNSKVSELSEVERLVMQGKHQFPKPKSPTSIQLSLCISKFATFSNASSGSKWKICRRDGLPYDEEDYKTFQLQKYIESAKNEAKSKPMEEKEKEDNNEEEIGRYNRSKKRGRERAMMNQEELNNRKQTSAEVMLADSESDVEDTNLCAVIDQDSDEERLKIKRAKTTSDDETSKKRGLAIFRAFEEKMKPLILLDYKDTQINIKSSCSTMWKKHKELFGEKAICGDTCKCLMWLPEMVENVVKEHMERQRKNNLNIETEEELEKGICGISKNFVPKFLHLLQKEYPRETETQLIHRLVEMWEQHQRNRSYGMRCVKGCGCLAEWDQIFGKGDKATAREYLSMRRHNKVSSVVSQSMASSEKALSGPVVPRKKRAHEQSFYANNIPSKKSKFSGLISSMSSRVNIFEVAFKSSSPIGGYFKNKRNRCQIFSIFLKGQLAKEPRIKNGTSVVSVHLGGTRKAILNYSELEKFYEDARRTRRVMYISFENQAMKPSSISISENRINKICWNDSGQWTGTAYIDEDDGWAGGALSVKPKPDKKSTEKNENTSMKAPQNMFNKRADAPAQNPTQESTHDVNIEEWTTIVNTEKPGQNFSNPLKNILLEQSSFPPEDSNHKQGLSKLLHPSMMKNRRERTHSKCVSFSIPNNKEIFFDKGDPSNVRRVLQIKTISKSSQLSQPQVLPEQALSDAFRNRSCNDVINILESHEFHTVLSEGNFDIKAVLQTEYTLIGNKLKANNDPNKLSGSVLSSDSVLQKNDLSAKYRVLNIYINCILLVEKTLALKKWYALTIELKYIDLQHSCSVVDEIGGSVAVKLDDGNVKEDLGSLPRQRFAKHTSYLDENLEYTVHNNENLQFEKRSFVIDLKQITHTFAPDRMLGTFKVELNAIEDKCLPNEESSEFTESLSKIGMNELSSGHVTLNIHKKRADKEYIMIKKHEIKKKFRLQLEYIERFNKDPDTPPDAKLTANILCMGGKSILLAAIVLMDDKDLVRKMLSLGADPRSSFHSGMGTPLSLAQRNFHSALEKERNMRRKGLSTEPQMQQCNKAKVLVELLQENVIDHHTTFSTANASLQFHPPKKNPNEIQEDNQSISGSQQRPLPKNLTENNYVSLMDDETDEDTDVCSASKFPTRRPVLNFQPAASNVASSKLILLPNGIPRTWVSPKQGGTRCKYGSQCFYYKRHVCTNWHDKISLDHKQLQKLPQLDSELPSLLEQNVQFNRQSCKNNVVWWTAAYTFWQAKRIVYVQKVLKSSGHVSKNGIVWFPTKEVALYSLQCTVYLYEEERTNHKKERLQNRVNNRGSSGFKNQNHNQRQQQNHPNNLHQQSHQQHRHHPLNAASYKPSSWGNNTGRWNGESRR